MRYLLFIVLLAPLGAMAHPALEEWQVSYTEWGIAKHQRQLVQAELAVASSNQLFFHNELKRKLKQWRALEKSKYERYQQARQKIQKISTEELNRFFQAAFANPPLTELHRQQREVLLQEYPQQKKNFSFYIHICIG